MAFERAPSKPGRGSCCVLEGCGGIFVKEERKLMGEVDLW
jgi:hypothetical protein